MDEYQRFLASKRLIVPASGFEASAINADLFDYQRAVTRWALRKGKCCLFLDTGLGKALTVDTRVLTPIGHKRMGDVQVGDQVIGSDGKATNVLGVYPQGVRPSFRVTFSDGVSVICDEDHLWSVRTKVQKLRDEPYRVMSLKEIAASGLRQPSQQGFKYFIPMVQPIEFKGSALSVDPYLLGVLIGDGGLTGDSAKFSTADDEMLDLVSAVLPENTWLSQSSGYDWRISAREGRGGNPLVGMLKKLGLMGKRSETKFIPEEYQFANVQDRISLLQGLLDTDGHVRPADNNIEYCTVSEQLAEDVAFLVQSLGGKAAIRTKPTTGQLAYRMSIALPIGIKPFRLTRKASVYKDRPKYQPSRTIVAIEEWGTAEMVCIKVDAPDSLFVIEHAIVTHNTACFLEWGKRVYEHTGRNVLILAPLAVAQQIAREGAKFGIPVTVCRDQADVRDGLNVTNYERLHRFDASAFGAVILDEGSILKSRDGATRNQILETFAQTPYKLIATATPSPNDQMELGTYAEFLGVMSYVEMLATFFCHDGGDTSTWRLKGHAAADFYRWLASWAMAMRSPADLGFDASRHTLPAKVRHQITVDADDSTALRQGTLFALEAQTLIERREARKASLPERVAAAAAIVNVLPADEKVLIWCNLNAEGDALTAAINGAVQVSGSDTPEHKERTLLGFAHGDVMRMVSKPSIAGFGMNFQACRYNLFVGLSDSFEELYQAERRTWRFGQDREVNTWIITSELEGAVVRNIERKEAQHHALMDGLVSHMRAGMRDELGATARMTDSYAANKVMTLPAWVRSEAA